VDVRDGRVGPVGRAVEALVEEAADLLVLDEQLAVERLGGVPAAAVRLGDADPEPEWMRLLSH
jgi:hypothetical protein